MIIGILLALRIYALYGCSRRILVFMTVIATVAVAIASWSLFRQTTVDPPQETAGCHTGLGYRTSIRIAGAWEALLFYDCIVFGLTIFKTWTARHDHSITEISIPLITLLLRDGSIYFAVMAFCNLANILTFYFAEASAYRFPVVDLENNVIFQPFMRGGLSTFASWTDTVDFTYPMTSISDVETSTRESQHPACYRIPIPR
ncbi:hypothetical protein D9619_011386 [Psilocybe cf. subviscida]|uniref:Uncharacterized protein n=1 Tax=Psilocybe cf. subviscida TaxID=2480587 RepID=A0A8H5BIX6_9AGAR|nr:hypothetical protein D9619_011386 [Psilocybe cf. subviscida]